MNSGIDGLYGNLGQDFVSASRASPWISENDIQLGHCPNCSGLDSSSFQKAILGAGEPVSTFSQIPLRRFPDSAGQPGSNQGLKAFTGPTLPSGSSPK
jgi:hypothetical protein